MTFVSEHGSTSVLWAETHTHFPSVRRTVNEKIVRRMPGLSKSPVGIPVVPGVNPKLSNPTRPMGRAVPRFVGWGCHEVEVPQVGGGAINVNRLVRALPAGISTWLPALRNALRTGLPRKSCLQKRRLRCHIVDPAALPAYSFRASRVMVDSHVFGLLGQRRSARRDRTRQK